MENKQNQGNNNNKSYLPLELLFEIFKAANTRQESGYEDGYQEIRTDTDI